MMLMMRPGKAHEAEGRGKGGCAWVAGAPPAQQKQQPTDDAVDLRELPATHVILGMRA